MTTNNHPAHGPVSLDRLHQIRETLSKAAVQSDGGNLCYAMADAVKVIDGAIAAFGAEPVGTFKKGPCGYYSSFHEDAVPLYTVPPAPVSVPDDVLDALQKVARIRLDLNDFDGDRRGIADCLGDAEEALIEVVNHRAAMLQAGNSPATPDGWIPVSERMPPEGVPLLICSGNGVVQRTVYGFDGENWIDCYEQYDPVKAEPDHLWQPLPAAPQQEVKSALEHGMQRYAGAMQKLSEWDK
ncbi:DUF551 domain-containing protein [Citrobacter braakii]|uniref:DUF551 domain-containing protein n=1 Tax=Citrobacter braakii TaxID=57706 RepID=UPI000B8E8C83|nr:DUF551 domain-containing protein [Citrobacter braakii]